MSLVLDTSAVSALMRREQTAMLQLRGCKPGDTWLVSPVAAEIQYGLERLPANSRRRRLLLREYTRLRSAARWHDWDEAASQRFGQIKAGLERKGQVIEDMDIAIAAVAQVLGASLATLNARHFSRIGGLNVHDWGAEEG